MKNLAIKLIAFLLISIFLTGCSYRKFEDSIRDLINNESSASSTEHAPILDDDIEILKIGDTHEVYVRAFEGSTLIEKGTKGLYITVDSVEIFNSFYDSGVEFNASILEVDGTLNEFTEKIWTTSPTR